MTASPSKALIQPRNATKADPSLGRTASLDSGFDDRWAAWIARGAAHERAARARLLKVAVVAAALLLAVLAYVLLTQ
jgi:hypothetical protein